MEQGRNSTSASTTESDLWVKVTGRTIRRERVVGRTAKTMWRTRKKRKREEEENCDMQSPQLVNRRHLLLPRRVSSYSVKVFLLLLVALPMPHSARANSPPRFVLDGDGGDGGDIVVRLKEGPATPPGTRILRLRGFDPDGDDMQFGVLGREGAALLRVENHNNGEASVYLNRVLDAETRSEYSAVLTLTDGRLGEGNFISRSFLLLVEDVNDNPPVFLPFPQTVSVREHAGPTVVTTVEATDRDSGVFGQVVYSLEAADGDTDDFPFTVRTSGGRGVVSVVRDLDFERKSVYELRVVAKDRASLGGRENTATAALLVKVEDISDAPPEFVSAPSVTRIPEDVPRFTEVLRVRAVDGDRGVNNPVVYSLVSGPTHLFAVNADTGVVYTRSELDRESSLGGAGSSSADGAFILGVEAREVGGGSGDPSATVEVTIILEDVNDETPTFRSQSYVAEIAENSQRGTPVNFVGGGGGQAAGIPEVFDHDAGSNGTFRLFLRDDLEGMFEELVHLEGLDATVGIASNIDVPCERDAALVRLLRRLGAVPFCRTNLSQTCCSFDSCNPIFGATRNPRDPKRSPGGSSGGEAALIANGGSVMGFGTDLGGSVRMPANFCGITSLKPTAGRLPLSGQESDGGLEGVVGLYNTLGFMCRSARAASDCMREMLDGAVLEREGAALADARFVPLRWREEVAENDRKLKIGWYDYDGNFEATPGQKRAVQEAVNALTARGHHVSYFSPRGLQEANVLYGLFTFADGGKSTMQKLANGPVDLQALWLIYNIFATPLWLKRLLRPLVSLFSSPLVAPALTAEDTSGTAFQLWGLNARRTLLAEEVLKHWADEGVDAVIAPGHTSPAQPIGFPCMETATISYTSVYNLLNFPAGSVNITNESADDQRLLSLHYPGREEDLVYGYVKEGTKGAEGMPLNVQVIGRPWTEELVLRVMEELEEEIAKK